MTLTPERIAELRRTRKRIGWGELHELLDLLAEKEAGEVERPEGEPDDWQYGYHAGIIANRPDVAKVIAEYVETRDTARAKLDTALAKVAAVEAELRQAEANKTILDGPNVDPDVLIPAVRISRVRDALATGGDL